VRLPTHLLSDFGALANAPYEENHETLRTQSHRKTIKQFYFHKLYELKAIAKRLNNFTFISRARRIEDNTLEIMFDKSYSYFFNLTRGHGFIYKAPSQRPLQGYNAPFDTLLHSLMSGSKLISVDVPNVKIRLSTYSLNLQVKTPMPYSLMTMKSSSKHLDI
jgi:hypothetical protein